MASPTVDLLGKILTVLDRIDKKTEGGTTGAGTARDPKTGRFTSAKKSATISNILDQLTGSKKDTKTASANIRELSGALKDLSSVKFGIFNKLALKMRY